MASGPKLSRTEISILTATFLAIFSAALGYWVNRIQEQRKLALDTVNYQLEKLYGPLMALDEGNMIAYHAFKVHYWSPEAVARKTFFPPNNMPATTKEVLIWRRWIKTVFHPIALRMDEVIMNNTQLMPNGEIPSAFMELKARDEEYKMLIARWDSEKTPSLTERDNIPLYPYPQNLQKCIEDQYQSLITLRAHLVKYKTGERVLHRSKSCLPVLKSIDD